MRFFAVLLLVLVISLPAAAEESIFDYNVNLTVEADGNLLVDESITVVAENNKINHGIYRDLVTLVPGGYGLLHAPLDIIRVMQDGSNAPWHRENKTNGPRIYIGDKNRTVARGMHVYDITYRIGWQVRLFRDYDEIYWNVTGNEWEFPIRKASVDIRLPAGAEAVQMAGYMGQRGEQGIKDRDFKIGPINYIYNKPASNGYNMSSLRPLAVHEGMTVAVAWPKGFIPAPTQADWWSLLFWQNPVILIGLGGLLLLAGYYVFIWNLVGRDPPAGPVVPVYKPAASPAAMRYVKRMGFDRTTLVAGIVSLAVKGYLRIEERGSMDLSDKSGVLVSAISSLIPKTYHLVQTEGGQGASADEAELNRILFAGRAELSLQRSNRSAIVGILSSYQSALDRSFNHSYFKRNLPWLFLGLLLTALIWVAIAFQQGGEALAMGLFMSVWLGFWSMGTGALLLTAGREWYAVFTRSPWRLFSAIFTTAFSLPFMIGWGFGAFMLEQAVGIAGTIFLVLAALLNVVFFYLLRAPTLIGQHMLDEVTGTELYITVAEEDRIRFHTPEDTPEVFEKFLPYAIALDLSTQWSERFKGKLDGAVAADQATRSGLNRSWYSGSSPMNSALAGALSGALTSAITAASASNRSGSSGGGSSGGGSGGGGGGGW